MVKTEPVNHEFPSETPESNVTWVKIKDITLTTIDKQLLAHGKKLTDKHIKCSPENTESDVS